MRVDLLGPGSLQYIHLLPVAMVSHKLGLQRLYLVGKLILELSQ